MSHNHLIGMDTWKEIVDFKATILRKNCPLPARSMGEIEV